MGFMLGPEHEKHLDRLDNQVRFAPTCVGDLFCKVIAEACTRLPASSRTRLDQLIEACAWIDAAFALIEFELPAWQLRRLVCEDGEWFCSLSRQPSLPAELDDTADASHDVLPLAILRAFLEARRRIDVGHEVSSAAPHIRAAGNRMICCDNFA